MAQNWWTLFDYLAHLKQKLDDCFTRKDAPDPSKRFARDGATKEIFETDRLLRLFSLVHFGTESVSPTQVDFLRSLAFEIRGSNTTSSGSCNTLAALLYARCADKTLRIFGNELLDERSNRKVRDADLPLDEAEALKRFGTHDGRSFYQHQFSFCPVILKESEESIYVGTSQLCPLPFSEEPVLIGRGATAKVYKVKIERGHLVNRAESSALQNSKEFAMKQFIDYNAKTKRSFEAEGTTIKTFLQAERSHKHILVTKASLEWGGTYSLFFDLAKYNLSEYFEDRTILFPTPKDKMAVFEQIAGLAGALAYLHDELRIGSTGEQLRCYHLDLKPDNILVFYERGSSIWKISDFGISIIRRISTAPSETHPRPFLRRIFKDERPNKDLSSGVGNPRPGGTYTAPEAIEKTARVTRASDVWSLGCIIALVLTFLDNQCTGIRDFENQRMIERQDDWFIDISSPQMPRGIPYMLRSSVAAWLVDLTYKARRRSHTEGKTVELTVRLLLEKILLVDPKKRLLAKGVEEELRDIQSCFVHSIVDSTISPQVPAQRPFSKCSRGPWRIRAASQKIQPEKQPYTWHFKISHPAKTCKFSSDGTWMAIQGDEAITTFQTFDTRQAIAGKPHRALRQECWADFSLGSHYLCAAVASTHFKCYYVSLSNPETPTNPMLHINVEKPVRKILLSPDDELTAFVLKDSQHNGEPSIIAVFRTRAILSSLEQSGTHSKENNKTSTIRSWTAPTSTDRLPWENIISKPSDCEIPSKSQIVNLQFSSDSKTLMAMTKAYPQGSTYQYEVLTWDMVTGRRVSCLEVKTEGSDGMGARWIIRAFALFASEPHFVAVSTKKLRLGCYYQTTQTPKVYEARPQATGDEFFDVIIASEEDQEVALIGRSNSKGRVKVFKLPKSRVATFDGMNEGIDTGIGEYDPTTSCCCLFREPGANGRRALLIAKVKATGRENTCKISLSYLDAS